ncbi:MAG: metalloregulator ArsR/SmtB family transcription factor, partial [Deltaproteobacteria bacterium]|nr:metalloregulator ArsR/SmtB family transcription factor [Deltaproteobacteria bacterium]
MIDLANALKLLGDDTRLRIMRLLSREALNVSELTSILGLAQSGISRHLSLLRKTGLVEERKEGVWTYYQTALTGVSEGRGDLESLWGFVLQRLAGSGDHFGDMSRLAEVLRVRENFGGGLSDRLLEPGQSWFAWSRALHFILPPVEAIDLGCGDGTITIELSRFARRVVGIDSNPGALEAARRRAERENRNNVEFREGAIEELKEQDGSFDLAVFSQSLHHMEQPALGLRQAVRVLRTGGRLLVVDLAPHDQ